MTEQEQDYERTFRCEDCGREESHVFNNDVVSIECRRCEIATMWRAK